MTIELTKQLTGLLAQLHTITLSEMINLMPGKGPVEIQLKSEQIFVETLGNLMAFYLARRIIRSPEFEDDDAGADAYIRAQVQAVVNAAGAAYRSLSKVTSA